MALWQQSVIMAVPLAVMVPAIVVSGLYWSRLFRNFDLFGGFMGMMIGSLTPWLFAVGCGAMSYLFISKSSHDRKLRHDAEKQGLDGDSYKPELMTRVSNFGTIVLALFDTVAAGGGASCLMYGDKYVDTSIIPPFGSPDFTAAFTLLLGALVTLALVSEPIATSAVSFFDERFGSGIDNMSPIKRITMLEREIRIEEEKLHKELEESEEFKRHASGLLHDRYTPPGSASRPIESV